MRPTLARVRIFSLMLVLGLIGVRCSDSLRQEWLDSRITLPQIQSDGPLVVLPKTRDEMPQGGGSGPHGPTDPESVRKVLRNLSLNGVQLRGTDLEGAVIESSDFSQSELNGTNLAAADVMFTSFIGSNLTNADFKGARVHGCDFTDAKLSNANLTRANLSWSDFTGANVSSADFTDANLSDARLEGSKGLTYEQMAGAVINEFTTLPPHLSGRRVVMLRQSKLRAK